MKCIEGKQAGSSVSIIAKAIGKVKGVKLTTQPAKFYPGDKFYTSEADCYKGPANVKVMCHKSALQAESYGLGNCMLLSTVIVDMQE